MRCVWTSVLGVTGAFLLAFAPMEARAADPPDHVAGRLLAVPRTTADPERVAWELQVRGLKTRSHIPALGLHVLDVPEEASELILQSLRQSGAFEIVERDHYARLAGTPGAAPNDPSYANQWHLPRISAPQAWNVTTGAASIVIAVIDSGVDAAHPDLASKLTPGWNFLTATAATDDLVGHGTAVAGTAAAASNNGIGVTGVTWNSRIMPLVVVDSSEFASYSNIAAAIQYAVDHGAQVINISIGGTSPSSVLQSAVDYAWSRNVVIFAAAMNDSSPAPNYPAACNHAVAVSATDSDNALASYSNYGNWITVAAPGSSILTTSMGGGYGYWYGTSFSAPIAAGVAALALAVDPFITSADLVNLIEHNTDNSGATGATNAFGWGRVNAFKSVTAVLPPASITAAPRTIDLTTGQTQQFVTTGTIPANSPITWSLSPVVGSISQGGLYTAPPRIPAHQRVTVTVSSAGRAIASSTVTLMPQRQPPHRRPPG